MPPGEVQPRTVQQHIARLAPFVCPPKVGECGLVVFLRRCCGIVSRKFFLTFLLRTAYSGIRRSEPPRAVAVPGTGALNFGAGFFFHISDVVDYISVCTLCNGNRHGIIPAVKVLKIRFSVIPAIGRHISVSARIVVHNRLSARRCLCKLVNVCSSIAFQLIRSIAHSASVVCVRAAEFPSRCRREYQLRAVIAALVCLGIPLCKCPPAYRKSSRPLSLQLGILIDPAALPVQIFCTEHEAYSEIPR